MHSLLVDYKDGTGQTSDVSYQKNTCHHGAKFPSLPLP